MASGGKCNQCNSLREEASAAIHRHLQAVGRRDLARLQHDGDMVAALEVVVTEAAEARERAVGKYKRHMASHGEEQAPAAAGSGT